ncbi:MAG TPA: (Fe-S)-binding protein, partial [Candidatus Kapabacteria bacterium]
IPIVVLEPSCASVFKDELQNLMPEREDAKRLHEHVYLLADFLEKFAPDFVGSISTSIKEESKALVQLHCHHQTVLGKDGQESVMKKSGIEHEVLDAGCCGMAGAFGFEVDKFDVSTKIGERKLFPKIRSEGKNATIIADGFSCREQVEQSLGLKTFHLAEILARNLANRNDS